LAVRNKESEPLEAVKVQISYPQGLQVQPAGKPRIDPDNRLLIYEHDLPDLQAANNYTPLESIDTIYLPYYFRQLESGILIDPKLNMTSVVSSVEKSRYPNGLELNVAIYSKNRPPLTGKVRLFIKTGGPLARKGDRKRRIEPSTREDARLFHEIARRAEAAPNKWVARDLSKLYILMYRKVHYQGGVFSVLLIDRKVRYITADLDSNGFADYTLADVIGPRSPDNRMTPLEPEPMVDIQRPNAKGMTASATTTT
jgi:hypothetical protein